VLFGYTYVDMSAQPRVSNERLIAAISYIGILFIVPLLTNSRRDPFVKFHIRQGIALFVIETVVGWVPIFGWALMIACIVAAVIGGIAALQGREWEIPVLGRYAKMLDI